MSGNLSLRRNGRVVIDAVLGTRTARRRHANHLKRQLTVENALAAIARRWPELKSPSSSEPIFILSAGWRSGSTFLQRLVMSGDAFIWGEPYRHAALVESMSRQIKAFTDSWPHESFFVDAHGTDTAFDSQWVANMFPPMADFLASHVEFFERLFARPSQAARTSRWGLKEIGLTVDHACYLKWLFPNARFVFLYRNPYDAYRSYRQWRNWYRAWPDKPVFTADSYGTFWHELAGDFIVNHGKVGGLLVPYEELRSAETRKKIESYLQLPIADPASLKRLDGVREDERRSDRRKVPGFETFLLRRRVEPLASQLGYLGNS